LVACLSLFAPPAWSHVPAPNVPIEVRHAACPDKPDALGCYDHAGRVIYLLPTVSTTATDRAIDRFVFFHEFGHAYDFTTLDEHRRGIFRWVMGWPRWRPEAFADWYARCALHERPTTWKWLVRYRQACRVIWMAA